VHWALKGQALWRLREEGSRRGASGPILHSFHGENKTSPIGIRLLHPLLYYSFPSRKSDGERGWAGKKARAGGLASKRAPSPSPALPLSPLQHSLPSFDLQVLVVLWLCTFFAPTLLRAPGPCSLASMERREEAGKAAGTTLTCPGVGLGYTWVGRMIINLFYIVTFLIVKGHSINVGAAAIIKTK